MFKLLLFVAIVYFLYRSLKPKVLGGAPGRASMDGRSGPGIDDVMERDPVCGVFVARGSGVRLVHGGKTLYFCGVACRDAYLSSLEPPGETP